MTCPQDCKCGNGICDSNETPVTCSTDCHCGNGICEPARGESYFNCQADCFCGNGICDTIRGESFSSCQQDCPQVTTTTNPFGALTTPGVFPTTNNPFNPGFQTTTSNPFGGGGGATAVPVTSSNPCNNDNFCNQQAGETSANCPADCGGTGGTITGASGNPGGDTGVCPCVHVVWEACRWGAHAPHARVCSATIFPTQCMASVSLVAALSV